MSAPSSAPTPAPASFPSSSSAPTGNDTDALRLPGHIRGAAFFISMKLLWISPSAPLMRRAGSAKCAGRRRWTFFRAWYGYRPDPGRRIRSQGRGAGPRIGRIPAPREWLRSSGSCRSAACRRRRAYRAAGIRAGIPTRDRPPSHEANRPAAVTARRCGQAASASATKPSF